MYIVVEKLKEYDADYGFDMRLKGFEQMEDAIVYAITAPCRSGFAYDNYSDVYETNVFELRKEMKIL
nr:MAG TPA: Sporulation initiation factor Spo0A C terminal [Inoviridae sp.]